MYEELPPRGGNSVPGPGPESWELSVGKGN